MVFAFGAGVSAASSRSAAASSAPATGWPFCFLIPVTDRGLVESCVVWVRAEEGEDDA
jgi:hypothetical protein